MKKDAMVELRTGMRVTFRNGETGIVLLGVNTKRYGNVSGIIISSVLDNNVVGNGFIDLRNMTDDLCNDHTDEYDIVKIEMPLTFSDVTTKGRGGWERIWSRKKTIREFAEQYAMEWHSTDINLEDLIERIIKEHGGEE